MERDLFDHYEELPEDVRAVLSNHCDMYGDSTDPDHIKELETALMRHGYIFDLGLDFIPYDLRKANEAELWAYAHPDRIGWVHPTKEEATAEPENGYRASVYRFPDGSTLVIELGLYSKYIFKIR